MGGVLNSKIIKLDFDMKDKSKFPKKIERVKKLLKYASKYFEYKVQKIEVAETRHGFHVLIYLNRSLPLYVIVFLQLWLGSDRYRELYNMHRIYRKHPANVLHTSTELHKPVEIS